jgi:hypothetical protein
MLSSGYSYHMVAHELDSTYSTVEAFAKENGLKQMTKKACNLKIVHAARIKKSYVTSAETHPWCYTGPNGMYRGK